MYPCLIVKMKAYTPSPSSIGTSKVIALSFINPPKRYSYTHDTYTQY